MEEVVAFVTERRGLPWVAQGIFFLVAPSPLSLLLFRFVFVSMSSGWFGLIFFLFFLGDTGGTAAAGVFGVAVDVVGDAAGF